MSFSLVYTVFNFLPKYISVYFRWFLLLSQKEQPIAIDKIWHNAKFLSLDWWVSKSVRKIVSKMIWLTSKNQLHRSRELIIIAIFSWTKWIFNLNIGRFCVVDIWPHRMSELSVNNNAQRKKTQANSSWFVAWVLLLEFMIGLMKLSISQETTKNK